MDYLGSTKWNILTGAGIFQNKISYQGQVPIYDENSPINSYDIDVAYKDVDSHVFQELQGQIGDKLQYTVGWRGENHTLSNTFTFDPRFSISIPLTEEATLLFSGGRYHQLPSLDYFDADFGNASLQPQRSWHAISGLSFEKDKYLFRLEGYYKRYSQLVTEGSNRNFDSNGNGYSRGVDIFLKRNHPRYSGWVSYSFLQSRREWLRAPNLSPTRFDISNQLTFVGKADLSLRWHLAFSYRYTTGRPYTSSATTYLDSRVPDYHKADASINYLRSFFPGNLTVFFFAIANVFNRDNIFDYRYSADFSRREVVNSTMRRNVYFGLSFTF
ncbi:MAG: TonB-dependent receptor [Calditrichota bacterium]